MSEADVRLIPADEASWRLDAYLRGGGYEAARKAVTSLAPSAIIAEVKKAGLRGRGGAGFPAGLKWSFVPQTDPGPKYLCVNADEGEPGTFKDRAILVREPHRLLEGMIIAAFAVGIRQAVIYMRGEYERVAGRLREAIAEAEGAGFLGRGVFGSGFDLEVVVHLGAGAYICGEETALLESIEGRRGQPRLKPPFPAAVGLFRRPTVINNVETLADVPLIVGRGADWFASRGQSKDCGTRLFSVSGAVRRPGLYELPTGLHLRRIIEEYAGGPPEGVAIKAVIPGGLSAPLFRADELETPMDFESVALACSMAGSAGIIVIGDNTPMLDVLEVMARFYAHESCGQCTPCRVGTSWIHRIVRRIAEGRGRKEDLDLILDLAEGMKGRTLCPMGDAAALPIHALVTKFREELERAVGR
jgi:NADH-quinone oxidoreductase subunit F